MLDASNRNNDASPNLLTYEYRTCEPPHKAFCCAQIDLREGGTIGIVTLRVAEYVALTFRKWFEKQKHNAVHRKTYATCRVLRVSRECAPDLDVARLPRGRPGPRHADTERLLT